MLSGTGDRPTLEPLADLVLDSVGEFISQSGEFFWEKEKSMCKENKSIKTLNESL